MTESSAKGFTLPEVMVSVVAGFVLIAAALSAFSYQQRAGEASKALTEMNQNIRTVLDAVTREIRTTGYGLNIDPDDLATWIDFARDSSEIFIHAFTSNPLIVQGAGSDPDMILMAGAFDPPVASLTAAAAYGETRISIAVEDVSNFNTTDQKVIFIGRNETVRITSISGNELTISVDPVTSRGLRFSYPSGTPIELVKVTSFEWKPRDANVYPREPHVIHYDTSKTWLNRSWQHMLSSHITDLQFVDNGDQTITLTVSGRSSRESPFYVDPTAGDHYRRATVSSRVALRNIR